MTPNYSEAQLANPLANQLANQLKLISHNLLVSHIQLVSINYLINQLLTNRDDLDLGSINPTCT